MFFRCSCHEVNFFVPFLGLFSLYRFHPMFYNVFVWSVEFSARLAVFREALARILHVGMEGFLAGVVWEVGGGGGGLEGR